MLKTLLSFVSIIVLILGVFLYSKTSESQNITPMPKEKQKESTALIESFSSQTPSQSNPKKATRTRVASKNSHLYTRLSLEEASLQQKPRPFVAPIMAIQMSKQDFKVGDILTLPNIDGIDYSITLSIVQPNADGSQSITGAYLDEGISYTTTLTQSSNQTLIALATAQGSYEIEASKGIGYVYKTQDIRKYMQPKPVNDAIILDLPPISSF